MMVRSSLCALALLLSAACDKGGAPASSEAADAVVKADVAKTEPKPSESEVEKRDEKPAAVPSKLCPQATVLNAMDSSKDLSAVGPFDLPTFTYAKATRESDGEVNVYISNQDLARAKLQGMRSLAAGASDAVVKLTFRSTGAALAQGVFGTAREGKTRVKATLFVKDMSLAVGLGESSAELLELRDGMVCGTFDLKGEHDFGHGLSHFAGSFVAAF